MSNGIETKEVAVERLSRHDLTLKRIYLLYKNFSDADIAELADCLLSHPDIVTDVHLACNQLTDETGVKLARYVAASSTVKILSLAYNQFGDATYLALAAALKINTSLEILDLVGNQAENKSHNDAVFVSALRINPMRRANSSWYLYSYSQYDMDFKRLRAEAEEVGHPSLQLLLCA